MQKPKFSYGVRGPQTKIKQISQLYRGGFDPTPRGGGGGSLIKILVRDPPTSRSQTKSTAVQLRNLLNFCLRTPYPIRKFEFLYL